MRRRAAAAAIEERWTAGGGEVGVDVSPPGKKTARLFVLGHGAGGHRKDPLLVDVGARLEALGHGVVRFDFRYKAEGRKLPDRTATLEATFRDVAARARERFAGRHAGMILGGKSMGGRMASHLAAQGEPMSGLLLLGYPLHPPKKPQQLRDGHLTAIQVPTLFISGTRDPLCELALLRPRVLAMGDRATLHVVEGGDHSLAVLKSSGRTKADVLGDIEAVIQTWVDRLPSRS